MSNHEVPIRPSAIVVSQLLTGSLKAAGLSKLSRMDRLSSSRNEKIGGHLDLGLA